MFDALELTDTLVLWPHGGKPIEVAIQWIRDGHVQAYDYANRATYTIGRHAFVDGRCEVRDTAATRPPTGAPDGGGDQG